MKREYLTSVIIASAALAVFGTLILAIGYKPVSVGRVATIVLLVGLLVWAIIYRRRLTRK